MDSSLQSISQAVLIGAVVLFMVVLLAILWLANLADRRRAAAGILPLPEPLRDPAPPQMGEAAVAGDAGVVGPAQALAAPARPAPARPGDPGQSFAILAYLLLAFLYGLLFFGGAIVQLSAGLIGSGAAGPVAQQANLDPAMLRACGLGIWLPALAGLILVLPPVRRLLARFIPINPKSAVHAVALAFTMMVVMNLAVGTVTLTAEAQNLQNGSSAGFGPPSTIITLTWIQDLYLLVLAGVGVGWLSRRNLAAVAARLGLSVPTWRQAGVGIALGLAMIPLVFLLTELAKLLNIPQNTDVEKISEALVGPMTQSALGIVTLGLAAALGEEAVFRGALQPRFGLVLTAVLFAAMHNQYAISVSTVVVLLMGLVLGLVRRRANTTTSMIVHAVYNSSLGLLAFLGIMK